MPEIWIMTAGIREVHRKIGHFGNGENRQRAITELGIQAFTLRMFGFTGDQREIQRFGNHFQLINILADHEDAFLSMIGDQFIHQITFSGIFRSDAKALSLVA